MNIEQRVKNYIASAVEEFRQHTLTIKRLSDTMDVMDFRRPDSGVYALRVVFDRERGQRVYISGDIGYAVIYPTCEASLAGMANCFTRRNEDDAITVNWGYFSEKIVATSDLVEWDRDDFIEDFKRRCEENNIDLPDDWLEEHFDCWGGDIEVDRRRGVKIWGRAQDELEEKDRDYWEWIYDCGKCVAARIILWLIALRLAYESQERGEAAK